MTAREIARVPFGLAVAMAGQDVGLVDGVLDEYETAHRAEVVGEITGRLRRTPRDSPDYPHLLRAARVIEGWAEAAPVVDPHAGDEQVRCGTPHCTTPEVWFAEAKQRGWVSGLMGAWSCPEHAAVRVVQTFPNRHEPRMILKAAPDQDLYIGWSTECEAPAGSWIRAEALECGIDPERLARADATGTSFVEPQVGTWDSPGMIAEQRGVLPRKHLAAYAELWLSGEQDKAYDLLEPFEGETEVRR